MDKDELIEENIKYKALVLTLTKEINKLQNIEKVNDNLMKTIARNGDFYLKLGSLYDENFKQRFKDLIFKNDYFNEDIIIKNDLYKNIENFKKILYEFSYEDKYSDFYELFAGIQIDKFKLGYISTRYDNLHWGIFPLKNYADDIELKNLSNLGLKLYDQKRINTFNIEMFCKRRRT